MNPLTEKISALRESASAPMFWGLCAVAAGAAVAPLDPSLLEEGIVVHTAQRIVAGHPIL